MGRQRKRIPANQICQRCRKKWANCAGLCRACGRETGLYTLTTRERDAARLQRHRPIRRRVEGPQPRLPVRRVGQIDYEVVWDGSVDRTVETIADAEGSDENQP